MKEQQGLGQILALSVVTAAAAEPMGTDCSARAAVLSGLAGALALTVLAALTAFLARRNPGRAGRMVDAALLAGFAWELVQTAGQAQAVCTQEFSSMALVRLLPLLLWVSSRMAPAGWAAPARVLWWGTALGCGVYALGLAGQLHWYPLTDAASLQGWGSWTLPVYAEYFAAGRLCPAEKSPRAALLPLAAFAVQTAVLLGRTMLFGAKDYPIQELLRAWGMGMFSRLDAALLLLWLACAIFRMGFLCTAVCQIGRRLLPDAEKGGQQA